MRPSCPVVFLAAAALLSACGQSAPEPALIEVPEDLGVIGLDPWSDPSYPPRLGTISATIDGTGGVWTTYDFSVGAFDASAWFSRSGETGAAPDETTLTLVGYPDANPRAEDGLLRVVLRLDGRPAPGIRVTGATIEVIDDADFGEPRLAGTGTGTLTSVTIGEGSGYGEAAGSFEGRLCSPTASGDTCLAVAGSFATGVQYEGF